MSDSCRGDKLLMRGMTLSVITALALFVVKVVAWLISGSVAILGDAAESVVHLLAIAFAVYSLWLSQRIPNGAHPYGFGKISFFSSGLEGMLIIIAGGVTVFAGVYKLLHPAAASDMENGNALIAFAAIANILLGSYLLHIGRKEKSIILESDGRHTLADSYTSIAVVVGLLLYTATGISWIDPLFGIAIALYVVYTGLDLCRRAFDGLMDVADPVLTRQLATILATKCAEMGIDYHGLRHRHDGQRYIIDLHLLFPHRMEIGQAHKLACEIELCLEQSLANRAHILTHLESWEDHEKDHSEEIRH
jgi:cation diffusion facilitator family transporter